MGVDGAGAKQSFLLLPEVGTQTTGVGDSHPELATNHLNPPNSIIEHGKTVKDSCRQSMLTAPTTLLLTENLGNVSEAGTRHTAMNV